ncbi:MAG: 3-oxoacyl-[acyl-carrier-protein] synthase [Blastocatellia bacterium]|jgi:3-oxoacyl-[acyl-carrier-protein] synthase-3|nr:3-oxoacyl-[acyl-carrier-protein] synthase [Blastocatellia bacterium]
MTYARIIGTGSYVPEKVLTNDDLSRLLGEDIDEFVSQVIGISERHVCADNESTADLATAAGRKALQAAEMSPEDLDLIVLATDTPEHLSPATSVVVQHRIGAKNAGTFDVSCACAGFVTALDAASKYIIADPAYRNVLVIGAYAMSKYIDWQDKKTATIFADGAGAVVLQASDEGPGFLASKLIANGSFSDYMGIYAGGTRMPITEEVLREGRWTKVRFARKYPPEVNIEGWPMIIHEVLKKSSLTVDDVALFLFTQVNLSTIKEVMKILEAPMERTHTIMQKWGYTGSACIPMVLDDAVREGKLKRGDNLIMCASGGGLNMACVAFRW